MKVLVVEDSNEIRARLMRLLAPLPQIEIVGVASSNREAVALFEAYDPDLVTLDISLRDGGSLGTLRRLMKSGRPPIVIVLTDHVQAHYRQRFMEAGAWQFLVKSDIERLQDLVRELMDRE